MKNLIFIGSSVCFGYGAAENRGWSAILAERLSSKGFRTENCAVCGETTADVLLRLERDVLRKKPDFCVVGLGLANEGLSRAHGTEIAIARGIFESNLRRIVKAVRDAGIHPVIGGVYPNNEYDAEQYAALLRTDAALKTWDTPVLEWLPQLDDGAGHFREGLFADGWHPNDAGYRIMADCIDLSVFGE